MRERHPFDLLSFVFGVALAALGTLFLVAGSPLRIPLLAWVGGRWLLPALVILAGLALAVPALRRQSETDDEENLSPPPR